MRISTLSVIGTILCACAAAATAGDWPQWRGPTGQGWSQEKGLPLHWDAKTGDNILWKTPLPKGDNPYSSPIVIGKRVIITLAMNKTMEHHVLCFDTETGKPLWDTSVEPGPWHLTDLRGGYNASTPAADGDRIYALFGSAVIAALDHQGKLLWRKELPRYAFDVAIGCSPVLFEDTLLLQADMLKKQSSLIAFDKKTGEIRWQAPRPDSNFAHGTPTLITLDAKPMLLAAESDSLQGVDPRSGEKLWTAKAKGDTVSPVFADGIAYIDSGRGGPGFAFAVDRGLRGDVGKSALKWNLKHVPEAFGSPIIVDKRLYRLQGSGILKCYSLTDGTEIFSKRLEGAAAAVSPVSTADGTIYFAASGKSYVIKAGAAFQQLGGGSLDDANYASPAIADGRIYLKGRRFLYCIGKR